MEETPASSRNYFGGLPTKYHKLLESSLVTCFDRNKCIFRPRLINHHQGCYFIAVNVPTYRGTVIGQNSKYRDLLRSKISNIAINRGRKMHLLWSKQVTKLADRLTRQRVDIIMKIRSHPDLLISSRSMQSSL